MEYRRFAKKRFWLHMISMPIIWAPLPVIIVLDIVGELYHHICFPMYGIEKVKRKEYVKIIDRGRLQYLNWFEKLGCMYCGYVNGLAAYAVEIAARTEKYWCAIIHEKKSDLKIHPHHIKHNFLEFDDEKSFKEKYPYEQ